MYIHIFGFCPTIASFEINFISKETSRAEPEYMNIHPPINALATALSVSDRQINFTDGTFRSFGQLLFTVGQYFTDGKMPCNAGSA